MRSTLRSRLRSAPALRPAPPSTLRRPPVAAGAAVAALTALAVAVLAGCTDSGSADSTDGTGSAVPADGTSVSPAPPGKYRTLPQPCTAVDLDSLKKLVPGATDYGGTEALTYDTDRLVGCSWKATAADGASSSLSLSVLRVVSYDPAVSDEVQAESDFDDQATAAAIPTVPPSGTPTSPPQTTGSPSGADPSDTAGTNAATGAGTGAGTNPGTNPGTDAGTTSATGTTVGTATATATGATTTGTPNGANGTKNVDSTSPDLAPRRLPHVGNAAFINDVLKTPATGPRRTVTLVFRTANVLATITYTQSSAPGTPSPKSADLQKAAQKVAGELEHKVEG